jgi:hypothetical protein
MLLAACGSHGETRGTARCMTGHDVMTVRGSLAVTTRVAGGTLGEVDADVVLVLGGLGEDAETVSRSMRMLEASGKTVLVVPGAEDAPLPTAHGRVTDLSRVAAVQIGRATLVPVPGCRFTREDLDRRAAAVPEGGRRILVSWAMPSGPLGSPGIEGVDAGDPTLRDFAERIHAEHALYAWPYEALGAVGPLAGPTLERADGTRAVPGPPEHYILP